MITWPYLEAEMWRNMSRLLIGGDTKVTRSGIFPRWSWSKNRQQQSQSGCLWVDIPVGVPYTLLLALSSPHCTNSGAQRTKRPKSRTCQSFSHLDQRWIRILREYRCVKNGFSTDIVSGAWINIPEGASDIKRTGTPIKSDITSRSLHAHTTYTLCLWFVIRETCFSEKLLESAS